MTSRSGTRRDAALLVGGSTVSVFGSSLTSIAVLLHTSRYGAAAVAGALICELLPLVLGAGVTGRMADRFSNKLLLAAGIAVEMAAVAVLAFELDRLAALYPLLFLLGCGSALTGPAAGALVPSVAGEERATRLYARMAMGRTLGYLGGWAVGGFLVQTLGARTALLIDAATFAVDAGAVLLLSVDRAPGRSPAGRERARAGFATFREVPVLGLATYGLTLMILCTVVVNVAEVFFVTGTLGLNGTWLGIISSCWMVGAFAGAHLAGRLSTERQLLLCLGIGGAAVAGGLLVAGVTAVLPATVLGYLVAGAGNGAQNVCQSGLVRLLVPDEQRGRVFAAVGALVQGGNVLGTAAGGPAVGLLGARGSFIGAGAVSAVPSAALLIAAARTARSPEAAQPPA